MGECRAKAGTSNAMLRAREKYEEGQRRIEQELKRASRPLPAEGEEHLDFDFDDVDPKEEVKDANVPSASNTEVPPEEVRNTGHEHVKLLLCPSLAILILCF